MSVSTFHSTAPALVILTAGGYAIATIGMKSLATIGTTAIGVAILVLGLGIAIYAEIVLLRQTHLALVYIAIVATETLLVLAYAFSIGEVPGLRQVAGIGLVLAGILTISS